MRRFLSITTVLALLFTMTSPIMAATCTGTGKAVSCHSMAASHCDRHEHHHHAAEAPAGTISISAGGSDEKCPMDCCIPGHGTTARLIRGAKQRRETATL